MQENYLAIKSFSPENINKQHPFTLICRFPRAFSFKAFGSRLLLVVATACLCQSNWARIEALPFHNLCGEPADESFVASKINSSDLGDGSFPVRSVDWEKWRLPFLRQVRGYVSGSITLPRGTGYSFKGRTGNLNFQSGLLTQRLVMQIEKGTTSADPRKAAQPLKSWRNGDTNLIDLGGLSIRSPFRSRQYGGGRGSYSKRRGGLNLCYRSSWFPCNYGSFTWRKLHTPTGLLNTDLSRLQNPSDGSMDNVHTLRDQYGADLVSLLTTTNDAGGLASTMQHPSHNFESSGFNVNVWDQLSSFLHFGP